MAWARAATVGNRKRSAMERPVSSSSWSRVWTRARSREWPPRSKKLSSAPTASTPITSFQTSEMVCSMRIPGQDLGRCLALPGLFRGGQGLDGPACPVAVRGQLSLKDEGAGHHVLRQADSGPAPCSSDRIRRGRTGFTGEIGHQPLIAGSILPAPGPAPIAPWGDPSARSRSLPARCGSRGP